MWVHLVVIRCVASVEWLPDSPDHYSPPPLPGTKWKWSSFSKWNAHGNGLETIVESLRGGESGQFKEFKGIHFLIVFSPLHFPNRHKWWTDMIQINTLQISSLSASSRIMDPSPCVHMELYGIADSLRGFTFTGTASSQEPKPLKMF